MTTAPSSPPEATGSSLGRLVELAFVVPVEVASRLVTAAPAVIDKVPAAVGRVRREVVLARFIGKLAVDQGLRELRNRITPDSTAPLPEQRAARSAGGSDLVADRPHEPAVGDGATDDRAMDDTDGGPSGTGPSALPDVDSLALTDYDHLSSAQVVAKLEGLNPAERSAIEAHERAGRHRRTILGKLEQLGMSS